MAILKFEELSDEMTAVALNHIGWRNKQASPFLLFANFDEVKDDPHRKLINLLERAIEMGFQVQGDLIARHKVDKRHHPGVKFKNKEPLRMPLLAVFWFPDARAQTLFKVVWHGQSI